MNKLIKPGITVLLVALILGLTTQYYADAAETLNGNNKLISVNNTDGQGVDSSAGTVAVSADGNRVLFRSIASNLPNYNATNALYLKDIKQDTTERVDVSTSGVNATGGGFRSAAISETGRYVAFGSVATNLIDGTTSTPGGIYIRDTQTGTTKLAHFGYNGSVNGHWPRVLAISNDGRFLTYSIRSGPSTWRPYMIKYTDLLTGSTVTYGGTSSQDVKWATHASTSCDGSFMVFSSPYNPSTNGLSGTRIYLADMRNTTNPIITTISGDQSFAPNISCNGNYITYNVHKGSQDDPTPKPSNLSNGVHLVIYNRITESRSYIDSDSTGTVYDNNTRSFSDYATASGGVINNDIFNSSVTNDGDVVLTYKSKVYLKHLSDGSGTLEKVMKTPAGAYLDEIYPNGLISANGKYIFYSSALGYDLGVLTTPSTIQNVIRTDTNI